MRIPTIHGIIDRRILVNFRVDADRLANLLPAPFRPQLVGGSGMAGICLIRLKQLRPRWLPAVLGVGSENAAHRIAVEWEANGQVRSGVYIPRRDTSSRLNCWAGGRVFPGEHHLARFDVAEAADSYRVALQSLDGKANLLVQGRPTDSLPDSSIFDSVADASNFFQCGSLGYSPNRRQRSFDALELCSFNWQVQPLDVEQVESSFFSDRELFPEGSVTFDNALLMRGIRHQWQSRESLPMGAAIG